MNYWDLMGTKEIDELKRKKKRKEKGSQYMVGKIDFV